MILGLIAYAIIHTALSVLAIVFVLRLWERRELEINDNVIRLAALESRQSPEIYNQGGVDEKEA